MKKLLLTILLSFCLVTSVFGEASRDFDGTDDTVNFGNVLNAVNGAISIFAWVNFDEDAAPDIVLSKKNTIAPTDAGYLLGQHTDDTVAAMACDGTVRQVATGSIDLDGTWYFIGMRWTGSTTDDLFLYVNGVGDGSDEVGTVGSLSNSIDLISGELGNATSDADGRIAYVMRYATAAYTEAYMIDLMYNPEAHPLGKLLLTPFWGDDPEIDLSGRGNSGTVTGSTAHADGPPIFLGSAMPL